jgi:hypothetical protein
MTMNPDLWKRRLGIAQSNLLAAVHHFPLMLSNLSGSKGLDLLAFLLFTKGLVKLFSSHEVILDI